MIEEKEIIEAGKFLKPHGLQGELNVISEYDPDILEQGYPMIIEVEGIYVPFYAESVRPKGHFASLVKLEGVKDVEEARKFVNHKFWLRRTDVAEFLECDIDDIELEEDYTGYSVYDKNAGEIGVVDYVDYSTANVLMYVLTPGKELIYIPLDDSLIEYVVEPDQENPESRGEIHMILPEGMIQLNAKK